MAQKSTAAAGSDPTTATTRWLDHRERRAWLGMAGIVLRLPAALDRDLHSSAGVSFFEYNVMAMLSEQPGRCLGMTELADASSASPSRLSHTAKRLEGAGFLERRRLPGVGRRTVATLTDAGFDKVAATAPGHVDTVRRFLIDALSEQQLDALADIGERVNDKLVEYAGSVDPIGEVARTEARAQQAHSS